MNVVVMPSPLAGTVRVPPSKSAAHRLLVCAALADGPTRVAISAMNRDIEATVACLRALGANIDGEDGALTVTPIAEPGTSTVKATGKREFGGTVLAAFTVKNVLGDADGNGEVNIADATLMQRVIAGYDDHAARANALCDFNGDGLNIADVTAVQRRLADLEVPYPVNQMTDIIV